MCWTYLGHIKKKKTCTITAPTWGHGGVPPKFPIFLCPLYDSVPYIGFNLQQYLMEALWQTSKLHIQYNHPLTNSPHSHSLCYFAHSMWQCWQGWPMHSVTQTYCTCDKVHAHSWLQAGFLQYWLDLCAGKQIFLTILCWIYVRHAVYCCSSFLSLYQTVIDQYGFFNGRFQHQKSRTTDGQHVIAISCCCFVYLIKYNNLIIIPMRHKIAELN